MNESSPMLCGLDGNRRNERRLDDILGAVAVCNELKQLQSCRIDKAALSSLEKILDDPGIQYTVREGDTHESVVLITADQREAYTSVNHALKSGRFPPGVEQVLEAKRYRIDDTSVDIAVSFGRHPETTFLHVRCAGPRSEEICRSVVERIDRMLATRCLYREALHVQVLQSAPGWLWRLGWALLGALAIELAPTAWSHAVAKPMLCAAIIASLGYVLAERYYLSPYTEFDSPELARNNVLRKVILWLLGGLWIALPAAYLLKGLGLS